MGSLSMRSSPQQLLSMPTGGGTLYLQIYHRMRNLILTGGWPAGTRLPSSRALAHDLKISRNTALLALEKLLADGWIQSRAGSGMYVSFSGPVARPALRLLAANDSHTCPVRVPFDVAYGAIDLFPVGEWAKIQSRVWKRSNEEALLEGSGAGWLPLRQAIAGYLYAVRGLACSPDQILIMSSGGAAVDLAIRVLARAGDRAWIENPGPRFAREAFHASRVEPVDIPIDGEGINISLARRRAADARFAYVSPACQFPTCSVLSDDRRAELLEWAARRQAYIIEDDRDFNAVFDDQNPVEPLAALSPDNIVHIHSFNRLLFPALRMAAMVVPAPLAERFIQSRQAIDGFPNMANQIALTEFIEKGLLSAHLRQCRLAYQRRREALHLGIRGHLSKWLQVDESRRGLNVVAVTKGAKASKMAAVARRSGIACQCLDDFSHGGEVDRDALVLGFGSFSVLSIDTASALLAGALKNASSTSAEHQ